MKKELGIFVLLVALFAYTGHKSPNFLSAYNLGNTSQLIGVFGIMSIGAGLVIITSGVDLTTGSIFALHGVLLSFLLVGADIDYGGAQPLHINPHSWPIAVLVPILVLGVLGIVHALLIAKLRLQAFIVTLCGLLIYRGMARVLTHDTTCGLIPGDSGSMSEALPFLHKMASCNIQQVFLSDNFAKIHPKLWGNQFVQITLSLKMPFIIMLAIAGIFWVVLHRSVYGRYLFAVGRNEDAAKYSGINTVLVIGGAYVLNMLLVGFASTLSAIDVGSITPSNQGNMYELYAIAAAVLGGCSLRGGEGSILGMVLGTILLQVLRNMVDLLGVGSEWDYVVTGGVILIAVTVDQLLANYGRRRARRAAAAASVPGTSALPELVKGFPTVFPINESIKK